jgi:hypothetical protein
MGLAIQSTGSLSRLLQKWSDGVSSKHSSTGLQVTAVLGTEHNDVTPFYFRYVVHEAITL